MGLPAHLRIFFYFFCIVQIAEAEERKKSREEALRRNAGNSQLAALARAQIDEAETELQQLRTHEAQISRKRTAHSNRRKLQIF